MTLSSKHGISTDKPSLESGGLLRATVLVLAILGAWAEPSNCPDQCNAMYNCDNLENSSQCLVMASEDFPMVNGKKHLHFCRHLSLERVRGANFSQEVQRQDREACMMACEFQALLSRYDCSNGFSVKWSCSNCTQAYMYWACAMTLNVYENSTLLKPCREFCHRVEEQCPYFHPVTKEQYAGEPVFICIDPNIPDLPAMSNSTYGPEGMCYRPCHVNASATDCSSSSARTLPSVISVLCVLWLLIRTRTQLT